MINRLLIGLIGLILLSHEGFCTESDSTKIKYNIGLTGGISQDNSFSGDLYGGLLFPIKLNRVEANFGYTFFTNDTGYRGVNDLQFDSHGLFVEGNYYLHRGLYGGIRWAVNFNWIDKDSQKLFDSYQEIDSPTFFSGIAGYGQVGYYHPVGDVLGIKFQAQIGLHNYKIAEGWLLIDNSDSDVRNAQFGIERHAELLYNLSVGLMFRL